MALILPAALKGSPMAFSVEWTRKATAWPVALGRVHQYDNLEASNQKSFKSYEATKAITYLAYASSIEMRLYPFGGWQGKRGKNLGIMWY